MEFYVEIVDLGIKPVGKYKTSEGIQIRNFVLKRFQGNM